MAKKVVKGAYLALGAGPTDYSAKVKGATLTISGPEVDVSNFDTGDYSEILCGLLKGSLQIEFVKDADLSGLDAAVFAALGSTLAFTLKLNDAAVGPTNPAYTGTCVITSWSPIAGSVGQAFSGSVTWPCTGAILRATT